jgi:hypothetical protein
LKAQPEQKEQKSCMGIEPGGNTHYGKLDNFEPFFLVGSFHEIYLITELPTRCQT